MGVCRLKVFGYCKVLEEGSVKFVFINDNIEIKSLFYI